MELLETMRVEAGGEIRLLDRHLGRIAGSAQYFGYGCDVGKLRREISAKARAQGESVVFRLLLSRDGGFEIQVRPLPVERVARLVLASIRVDSGDLMLRHKTTARDIYQRAKAGLGSDTDAILVNGRGEATETSIANIGVLRRGKWVTPPVACGLLPGTLRAELLEEGQIVEDVIPADELVAGEMVRCFNAVRGVFDVPFADILAR